MINVAVSGFAGRMGSAVVDAVTAADDMQVTCGIDPHGSSKVFAVYETVEQAVHAGGFDVLVDFTQPSVVEGNLRVALAAGIDCVVGTTGLANDKLEELAALAPEGTCLFYAPNFTTGAVLMMQFAKAAAPFFPEAEVLEFHHCNKKDAPPEPPCARRRSSPMLATAVKAPRLARRPKSQVAREPAARWWKACPCTRFAPWAMLQARKWCSVPWARPLPSATIRGIALRICPACCWASEASATDRALSSVLRTSWDSSTQS